ncbi:uncharacterized protein AAEQ78_013249 [Lycaon pictus]
MRWLIEWKHSPSVWTCIEDLGEKKTNRDMRTTQVSFSTIESVLMMTLEFEKVLFFHSLLHKRCSIERESQEGFFWRRRPLRLRDMYRPLNATRKKNMAQKLHDRDSSDEDEFFNKEPGEKGDAPAENPQATNSAAEDLGEERDTELEAYIVTK